MYVWGRLAWMAATARRRGPFRFGEESRLSFRCLPHDIDRNVHLNNARYMMLADVGRIDIFHRAGVRRAHGAGVGRRSLCRAGELSCAALKQTGLTLRSRLQAASAPVGQTGRSLDPGTRAILE